MIDDQAEAVVQRVINAALDGDLTAAKLVLERLVPPTRERPVQVAFTVDTATAGGVAAAADDILKAACAGELAPGEASVLASIVELRRRAHETEELERRIAALENEKEKKR